LPERLYAGGATSDRGFPINGAGPRDLQTGYPVGGNGVIVNSTELRLPAATLPYLGDSLSFVLFHDMGNVFAHVSDMFPGIAHFHQPNQETCANVGPPQVTTAYPFGTCNFNYFSMRWELVRGTRRRWGRSGWTSAITSIRRFIR